MGSKRPPAIKESAFVEIDIKKLKETGEIKIIGSPIIAPEITTSIPRGKFEIVYTAELFDIVGKLGNQKVKVLAYMLDHKDGNNCLNATNSQLAQLVGVSRPTVIETMKVLQSANLVTRKNSIIMISPGLMVKGSQVREAYLMRKFVEMEEGETADKPKYIDAEIEGQLAFNDDLDIVEKVKTISIKG